MRVLDAFGGRGLVWAAVQREVRRPVDRVAIDKRRDIWDFHFHGDNERVLAAMDLATFDVVDLDAYGVPADQIMEVARQGYRGVVFATFIQSMTGRMPDHILRDVGVPEGALKAAPSLLARRGFDFFCEWLHLIGVREIVVRSHKRKHYMMFRISDAAAPEAG